MNYDQSSKEASELMYWRNYGPTVLAPWYRGEVEFLHTYPAPTASQRRALYCDEWVNAAVAFRTVSQNYYLTRLRLDATSSLGRLLDIGCGPLCPAGCFVNATVFCVDPLAKSYLDIGYPMRDWGVCLLPMHSENMWTVPDGFFDTIVAVNAIDHVDNFERTVAEIERVAKDDALVVFEAAYHPASLNEPIEFTDEMITSAFKRLPIMKVADNVHSETFRLTLWTTKPGAIA